MSKKSILIAAGGTGGHVFPGLALAKAFQARGYFVSWAGTAKGIEAKVIPTTDIPLDLLQITGIRGKGALSLLFAPIQLLRGIIQAMRILKNRKPALVIGLGGFVFGPIGIAAAVLRIPMVLHEQNAIPGTTNRFLSITAKRVFSSFPDAFKPNKKVTVTGNPVRKEITALPEPNERFQQHTGPLRILVLGGSLGALRINEVLPEALDQLDIPFTVWHQCGESTADKTAQAYQTLQIESRVDKFIDDMAQAYAWADLVICRAGATTISELIAVGLGSILIPYPFAIDDHQTKNGLYLVKANAAFIIAQKDLSASSLAEKITQIGQRERCLDLAHAARKLYTGDATSQIIEQCEELLNG